MIRFIIGIIILLQKRISVNGRHTDHTFFVVKRYNYDRIRARTGFSSPSLESPPNNATVVYPSFFTPELILISSELISTRWNLSYFAMTKAVADNASNMITSIASTIARLLLLFLRFFWPWQPALL